MTTQPRLFTRTREQHKDFRRFELDNFVIALLDKSTDDTHLREQLCRSHDCHYFRASTMDNFLDLVIQDKAKNAVVVLIISNRFLDFNRDNLLHIAPKLLHIYLLNDVLCNQRFLDDQQFHRSFDDVDSLFTRIRHDTTEARHPRQLTNGIQLLSEESAEFFWHRFFFHVLDRLQHTEVAKHEVLPRLRDYYNDNGFLLKRIDEFEHEYRSEEVIWWYTGYSFFYRLLNKTMRTSDINEMFLWRSYIQELDRALRQLQSEQDNYKGHFLYRGQALDIRDIKTLSKNVGKLITMTSFLSTCNNLNIATMCACSHIWDQTLSPVLFTINVNSNDTRAIFADIRYKNYFPDEDEYLFSLRSLFRIDRVELETNLWHIDLTAVDEDDQEFCTAINPWKAKISEQSFFSGRHQPLFTRYLNPENSSFLAFQLLIDLMLRLNQTSYAREEMIEMCRLKYSNSPSDLNKIDEFEPSYNHQDAAKWYTTDSFLYRLLNTSLRLEDIDTIFKLRYYIYDLHNQLAQLQTSCNKSLSTKEPILTLYRGQRMSIEELNELRENVGKLISKNSFLSTTNDVQAAVFFSGADSLDNPDREASVLYQITVDTNDPYTIPFAQIDYLSVYEDEDEVLFSMAAVFRIDNVEPYGSLWVVDLTLINKEDETWNQLTAHLNR